MFRNIADNLYVKVLKSTSVINHQNNSGVTELMRACYNESKEYVFKLLESGADPNLQDHSNETALHWYLRRTDNKYPEIAFKLIECKTNLEIKNKEGYTVLMKAIEYEHYDIVDKLLEYGADVNNCSPKIHHGIPLLTLLWNAVQKSDEEYIPAKGDSRKVIEQMFDKFIAKGVNVNQKDGVLPRTNNAMFVAIDLGLVSIIYKLIDAGMDLSMINSKDIDGVTAFMMMCSDVYARTISVEDKVKIGLKMIEKCVASKNENTLFYTNSVKMTAYEMAKRRNLTPIVEMLDKIKKESDMDNEDDEESEMVDV